MWSTKLVHDALGEITKVKGWHAMWTAFPWYQNKRWAFWLANNRSLPGERKVKEERGLGVCKHLPKGEYNLIQKWLWDPELPTEKIFHNSRDGGGGVGESGAWELSSGYRQSPLCTSRFVTGKLVPVHTVALQGPLRLEASLATQG